MAGTGTAPDPDEVRTRFAPLLADPGRAVVAVDYDGTLAAIVPDPELAVPVRGALDVLTALASRLGRLGVVTGRPAEQAVLVGGLAAVPGLVVLGGYGSQRWEAGRLVAPPPHPGLDEARARVQALLAGGAGGPAARGAWFEDKGAAFAVHLRRAADPVAATAALRGPVEEVARSTGLRLEPGRLVLEVREPGTDKGSALLELVGDVEAMTGGRPSAVLYAGDDLGDRPALDRVRELATAGVPAWSVVATAGETPTELLDADVLVAGPEGVVALLEALLDALGGASA